MKSSECLWCGKKISKNARWCYSECKKQFILSHLNPDWLKEDKSEIILTKSDIEDLKEFLEEYLKIFRNKKEHQKIHKKEPCPKCQLVKSLLRKLK